MNQERGRWVALLHHIVVWLDNCTLVLPLWKAHMFDIIYSVFPLRCHQGIVGQYSACNVNGIPRDLVPNIV